MAVFLDEMDRSGEKHSPKKFSDFREVLERVAQHPNRRYFILKSIIINNLYGVDIMEEATEICKLRLFLKLVAQVGDVASIEPLPDIDFNIRAGNTLVGFTSAEDVRKYMTAFQGGQMKLLDEDELQSFVRFNERVEIADRAFQRFHEMQTEQHMDSVCFSEAKRNLRTQLDDIADELNQYLAHEYGVETGKRKEFQRWLLAHQPFHWFSEFYNIMRRGGFDIIIGNPPYVESSKLRDIYSLRGYHTLPCGNLYANVFERSLALTQHIGRLGLIVPLSVSSTSRMQPLQEILLCQERSLWLAHFDVYPSKLFEGAKQRLTISLVQSHSCTNRIFTTGYNRWFPGERIHLVDCLSFSAAVHDKARSCIPKTGRPLAAAVLQKLSNYSQAYYDSTGGRVSFYVHRIPYNYIKALDFVPYFWNEVDGEKKSEDYKPYYASNANDDKVLLAMLSSNLFFFWWYSLFEGYHCGRHEIQSFPCGLTRMRQGLRLELADLAGVLMKDMRHNRRRKECTYKNTGHVVYEELYPRLSKSIIDKIDCVLQEHFCFSDEELDYLVNFDIKYRVSSADQGEEE